MAITVKYFTRSSLRRCAIVVGSITILGSLWDIIGAALLLITPDPDFDDEINCTGSILIITVASLFGFAGSLLVIGTYKNSHLMFLPWLFVDGVGLVIHFTHVTMSLISSQTQSWGKFAYAMVYFSIIGLCAYVWFAILTFYQIIRDEKTIKANNDDEEKLCPQPKPVLVPVRNQKPYPPPYVIPITYSDPKQPASQIKY